jgi:hypothetical protein
LNWNNQKDKIDPEKETLKTIEIPQNYSENLKNSTVFFVFFCFVFFFNPKIFFCQSLQYLVDVAH